jgi:CBS domain-containing protein
MTVELEAGGLKREDPILKIAIPKPVCCGEAETLRALVDKMVESGFRRIPIISDGKMVGILTSLDVLDAFLRREDFDQPVSTIMVRDVIYCRPDDTIGHVLQKFKLSRRGGFPIVKGGKPVAIVTERDIIQHFCQVSFGVKVRDVMTPKPLFISARVHILDCLKSVVNTRFRRLPVVENEKVMGLVTTGDLLRYIRTNGYAFDSLDEPLNRVIKKPIFTVPADEDVQEAVKIMIDKKVGGLLILEGDRLEGIITERDILMEII